MTTITIERALLEQALEVIFANTVGAEDIEDAICAALAAPATAPAQPAWHDAPTCEGMGISDDFEGISTFNSDDIQAFKTNTGVRWYGPIPPDGDKP